MNTLLKIAINLLPLLGSAQVSQTYKINELLNRVKSPDTTYVMSFWATWCKPCIQELPSLDSLSASVVGTNVKVLLVNLDFKEELATKVIPFLKKNKIRSECVLLDEVNGNDFVNLISKEWSGAIPASYIKRNNNALLFEKKMTLRDLKAAVERVDIK